MIINNPYRLIDKTMTFLSFKEDSILNNGFARGVNLVVWVLILIACIAGENVIRFPAWRFLVVAVIAGIATAICLEKVMEKTTFYEWDYTERKKKSRFSTCYVMICSSLWVCIWVTAFLIYDTLAIGDLHWVIRLFPIAAILFFVFNVLNLISLFQPVFEHDLKTAYKIQKKPENWIEDGSEINDDDEIRDIMRRDFGV